MALLGLILARSVLFFLENTGDAVTARLSPLAAPKVSEPVSKIDIASLNLFGTVQRNIVVPTTDAPATKLNLLLQGVFLAEQAENSSAIVAGNGKEGELFNIGDTLPGNAVLAAVLEDHILLRRGGRMEKLMFSDNTVGSGVTRLESETPESQQISEPTKTRLQQVRERLAERQQSVKTQRPSTPGSTLKNYVSEYRDKIEANPDQVLAELGMSEVTEGETKAYKLDSAVSDTTLMQAGLQTGDVILSVNGQPVAEVINDTEAIDRAMQSQRVRVEVKRGNRRFFLTVPIP